MKTIRKKEDKARTGIHHFQPSKYVNTVVPKSIFKEESLHMSLLLIYNMKGGNVLKNLSEVFQFIKIVAKLLE